jgi:hypothetical protein
MSYTPADSNADWARFRQNGYSAWGSQGFWALFLYRLQKAAGEFEPGWLSAPARLVLRITRKLLAKVTLIDIDPDAEIGPALITPHGGGSCRHIADNQGICSDHRTIANSDVANDARVATDEDMIADRGSAWGAAPIVPRYLPFEVISAPRSIRLVQETEGCSYRCLIVC